MTSGGALLQTVAHPGADAAAGLREHGEREQRLWDSARSCLGAFAVLFGAASDLVAGIFIRRAEHKAANAFLRGLESLVRRILVVAASRLVPHLPDFTPPPREPSIRLPLDADHQPTAQLDLSDRPQEKWPAMFRVMPRLAAEPDRAPVHARPLGPRRKTNTPSGFLSSRSLALRLEAVRRVIDDPSYFIRAMAWQLKLRQRDSEAIVLAEDTLSAEAAPHLGPPLQDAANMALDALAGLARPDTS